MLLARNHHRIRLFVGSAVCLSSVVVLGGRAYADDPAPSTPDPVAASTPPSLPATDAPADTPPAADPPPAATDPAPSDPPADPPATDPPATIDTPASETTTPPPTNTNDQNANATTTGTAIADTGSNTAASGTNSNVAGSVGGSTNPSANVGATSGTAGATGSQDTTQVDQIATATTNGQGAVDILQVALVINLGVSNGQSGSNTAIAAGGPGGAGGDPSVVGGGAQGAIDTGNASAVGNRATTTVTQAAVVAGGDASTQIAAVLNIGIGVGNTGLNVAVGNVTVDGISAAQLTLLNSGTAAVQSGDADALGNRSDTRVLQSATGTASGTAVLQIGQWAIVLNFGTAFANTGGNAAVAGTGPGGMGPAEYQAVLAIMNVLAPILDGLGTPTGSTVGNSSAVILTGDAAALGNDASTTIAQTAAGAVSGSQYASASQRATVANLGLALANTGYNASLANTGALDLASLAPATSQLSQFFGLLTDTSWLSSANPFASFAQSVDLGGLTLSLGGDISGTQFLLGWDDALVPDGGPITPGVRVRQISAVLNIGIALADSGSNTSLALVSGANTTTSSDVQALLSTLSSTQGGAAANGSALARIATGDASAVGSDAVVKICQAFHDARQLRARPRSADGRPRGPDPERPTAAGHAAGDPGRRRGRRLGPGYRRRRRLAALHRQ